MLIWLFTVLQCSAGGPDRCGLACGDGDSQRFSQQVPSSVWDRDGPKFGVRRSSAEEFGRMFGSVRLGNM